MRHAATTTGARGAPVEFATTGPRSTPGQRGVGLAAVLLLAAGGLFTLRGFLPSLVWAVILAIALWPGFERLAARWPKHRRLGLPALMTLLVLLLLIVPLLLVAIPLISDTKGAAAWVQEAKLHGVPPPDALAGMPFGDRMVGWWRENLSRPGQISVLFAHAMQGGLLATARAVGAELIHRLVQVAFTLLALFFLLREGDEVARQLRSASERAFGPRGEIVGEQMIRSVHATVNGLVLVGLAEGAVLGVAYWFTGVPHATLFGLFTAVVAAIPFGAPIAFLLAALLLVATGNSVGAAVVVGVGFLVLAIADHFVRPLVIGGATRLPFLWVLLGILGGVEAWGLFGLFLGPALMAALMLLWREWAGVEAGPLGPERTSAPVED